MLSQEYVVGNLSPSVELLDPVWLAGAKAGFNQINNRPVDEHWLDFLETLAITIEAMPDLDPAEPGTAPDTASLYEVLGGYVSVTGRMGSKSLFFPVPLIRQKSVLHLFSGMEVRVNGPNVVVAFSELQRFCKLVPIRGPIETSIEVMQND